jgi:hypothetical protein
VDTYSVALYVHLLALLAAIAAASLMHFAESRRFAATTRLEVLPWLGLAKSVSRVFPLSLLVLFASGSYLVHKVWTWDIGWVQAGIVGLVVLFASGIAIGKRSAAFAKAVLAAQDGPLSPELRAKNRDRIVSALSWMNTGVALAVVFVMVYKHDLAFSLVALAIGAGAGIVVSLIVDRSLAGESAPALSPE